MDTARGAMPKPGSGWNVRRVEPVSQIRADQASVRSRTITSETLPALRLPEKNQASGIADWMKRSEERSSSS